MTGNVSQGRTCEYVITLYDPVTFISTNINTYDISVDVEYVNSDTYLGVYKYTLDSGNTELIQEVGAGFVGSIQTTVDINFKVYVQMYPNSTSSSAIFNISSVIVSNTTENNTTTINGSTTTTNGNTTTTSGNTTTTIGNTTTTTTYDRISYGTFAGILAAVVFLFIIISLCYVFRRYLYK